MDPKVSPLEDNSAAPLKPFWLRCIDCGGAVGTAVAPELPESLAGLVRPLLKVFAFKLDLSPEIRATVTGDNPFALLGDEKLVPTLFNLRCADCTVKHAHAA